MTFLRICALVVHLALAAGLNAGWNVQKIPMTPENWKDRDENNHQTIVILDEDPAVIKSTTYLFQRNPTSSTILWYHKRALDTLHGSNMLSSRNIDLVLVGHGSQNTTTTLKLAGYGPEEVALIVYTLKVHSNFGHIKSIHLLSCKLGNDQDFTLRLLQDLRLLGVETTLHLHKSLLSINSDGWIMAERDGVWRSHDHSSSIVAMLNARGELVTKKPLGCESSAFSGYKGNILYHQTLDWPSHPQMFVPMELRKKYHSIDCLEGLTWSLFFEENGKRRAPEYVPDNGHLKAIWLQENQMANVENIVLKHISNIQDLLVEIRYNAREEVTTDLYYVLNECIYKVCGSNLSVSLEGKFIKGDKKAEIESFRQTYGDLQGEASLQEMQQGLKASKFNDFCRQTFQFQQCTYNCERWGRYFMSAVFSASVRNFRTFSLFLMSVIGCEVGRSRGTDSHLCTAFMGQDHPMISDQPWPEEVKRGFYGCAVDNYEMAPENKKIWLDHIVAKENALYIRSKQIMDAASLEDQTELEIFGKIKVMNKYVFSSYLEYFRGTPEGKKLKIGCNPSFYET